jgi:putative endonuclease
MSDFRRQVGLAGEEHVLAHYLRLGCTLVERNSRTRHGEIDLIVLSDRTLIFCEVRTRLHGHGDPLESFGQQKALQVRRMAANWLADSRLNGKRSKLGSVCDLRLDAAAVTVARDGSLQTLQLLEGAL